jgi:hypothetical protein
VGRAPRGGAVGTLGGESFYVRGIFILNEMWTQVKTYFDRYFAWLKYVTLHLVPVLYAAHFVAGKS